MLFRHRFALRIRFVALVLATCAPEPSGLTAAKAPSAASPRDLAPILRPVIERAKIPGLVAVVLRGDGIIAEGVAGVRKRGAAEAVTLDDQFQICSGTKAMTATLVARLVEQGRLRWDTPLAEIFRDSVEELDPAWQRVTVQQLLTHRAGLKDHLIRFLTSVRASRDDLPRQRLRFSARVLARPPDFPPGTKAVYVNTDYLLVGAALEQITGRPWEDLMREELFQPFGLTTAGFGPPGTGDAIDQPWGHGRRRLFYLPLPGTSSKPYPPDSKSADFPAAAGPAGMVHLSIREWARFVALHLRGDPGNPQRAASFLAADTYERLHQREPGEIYMFASDRTPMSGTSYAAGWFVSTRPWAKGDRPEDTGRVLFHAGDNGRWNCVVWVAPEIDLAVLVACNRASMWGPCDEVAGALIGEFAGKPRP